MSVIKTLPNPLLILLGPTACGKTKLAVELAQILQGEIISADSRQVYRRMDIGSGKDLAEYGTVPHHLIDIVEPYEEYNAFRFAEDFCEAFKIISDRGKLPILAGGTGMYLDSIIRRYPFEKIQSSDKQNLEALSDDELKSLLIELAPKQHNKTDLEDRERTKQAIRVAWAEEQLQWPHFQEIVIGVRCNRDMLKERITHRLKQRLENGMVEEVEALVKEGLSWEKLYHFGLEYRFIAQYLKGDLNYNDMYQKLNSAIHYFSKQQMKWFKKMENRGTNINWIDIDKNNAILQQAQDYISASAAKLMT